MGLFDSMFGSPKSRFESEMEQVVRQTLLAMTKVQEGMRTYLLKYLQANAMPADNQVIEETFIWLISGSPPPQGHLELSRRYVDILKTSPLVTKAFATAMCIKVNMLTSQGLMSEAMRLVKNLTALGLRVFSFDMQLPNERAFIAMADEFYNGCQDMVVQATESIEVGMPALDSERYELRKELGRGGFGVVHLAYDKKLRREVAIKRHVVDRKDPRQQEFLRRFEREAITIASLNHPNIVQIYDFDSSPQGYSIVMEYVPGGPLRQLLDEREGVLPVETASDLALQICDGLAHAHSKGIIHRDIKPQNILIDRGQAGFHAKIADFGIARGGESTDSCHTDGGLGTPLYMSPEQRVDARNVTLSTDVYSFGKMLHEMLTGEIGLAIDLDNPALPADWRTIVEKCTYSDPALRYADARDVRAAASAIRRTKGE